MPATDDSAPASPTDGDRAADDTPGPPPRTPSRGGRPGVTRAEIADALDAWIARTGRSPSLRELRRALGDRGSMSTLAPLRAELLGERLLAGDAPAKGGAEDTVARAVNAAMSVLAAELAEVADDAVSHAERQASDRVAAADARATRATTSEAETALGRERALGEVAALERALADGLASWERLERDLAATLDRVQTLRDEATAANAALATERDALARTRGTVHTLEARLGECVAGVERERTERTRADALVLATAAVRDTLSADVERQRAELSAAHERASTLAAELARLSTRLDAADARASEATAHASRLARERDTARDRAGRSDVALDAARRDTETALASQAASARSVLALHTYVGTLHARLRGAGVAPEDIEPVPDLSRPEDQHMLDIGPE